MQTPPKKQGLPSIKQRSQSQKRLIKLERISFEIEAKRLRKQYDNKMLFNEMKMKSKSQKKKMLTEGSSEDKTGNFLKPTKIISVTAQKWAVYDYYSSRYLRGYRAHDSHELSSFSKLLVFCAVNTIVQKYSLDIVRFETIVTEGVLKLHKYRCMLKVDDILSLQDLLHLMIMQESEAYQTILAVNVGAFLEKKRQHQYYSVFDNKDKHMRVHLKEFYALVNSYCQLLKLENIRYVESDPVLKRQKNKGSAADVAVLSVECIKIPLFMRILNKVSHEVTIKFINGDGNLTDRAVRVESNSILNKYIPYSSICRNWQERNFMNSHCSLFHEPEGGMRPIIAVLLGCYGPSDREKDIQQVVEWYLKNGKEAYEHIGSLLGEKPQRSSAGKLERINRETTLDESIKKKLAIGPRQGGDPKKERGIERKIRIKTNFA